MSDPQTRAARGLDCLSTIAGSKEGGEQLAAFFETRGALGSFAHLTAAGEIWSREQISRRDRSLIVISALVALGREVELQQHVDGGLNHGLTVDEVDEILVQLSAYVGMPFALAASLVVDRVVAARGGTAERTRPRAPALPKDDAARRAAGLDVLTTLLGDPDLDKAATEQAILDQQGDLGALVMDFAFGDVWSRPQLPRRDRSLAVISALTAINMTHELEIHIGAGMNHGLTPVEIGEVMITMVAYGGFPRAIDGMLLARKVFTARGVQG
jgi:4-carboxymuconolactone decarboxylase